MKEKSAASSLLKSGILFSAISFITSLGHFGFQAILGRYLNKQGDFGGANSVVNAFMPLLGLVPATATFAVTHYIAHYNTCGDHARLQGLLLGCRRFLLRFTIAGSVLALVAIHPLSQFFKYSDSLMVVTLGCTLFGLWGSFATALCQGMGWFQRLALIGFVAMLLRVGFGWLLLQKWPVQETVVLATGAAVLANLAVLLWRKELSLKGEPVSPWNREFVWFFMVSAAFVVGNYCFFQSDVLVAQRNFVGVEKDAYMAAGVLARAVLMSVAPMLVVLFTSRSGQRSGHVVGDQLKLLGLTAFGFVAGAAGLIVLRGLCLRILHKDSPEAAAMIVPYAVTMIFVGLLQSLAYWALASRWAKVSFLYGALGLIYVPLLFWFGKTPSQLLHTMVVAAGATFVIVLATWLVSLKRHHPPATAQS
jgi:hypothetical protein